MRRTFTVLVLLFCVVSSFSATQAAAQGASTPIGIRGYGSFGATIFSASDSFDAVLDTHTLPTFGGGVEVVLRENIFIGVGVWRASHDGERVFVGPDDEVFKLGIPLEVRITPIEITGGWRFTNLSRRFVPYVGGGFSSFQYSESSETDDEGDDVDDRFSGGHILGGVDVRLRSWLGVAGEIVWTSIPDAIGASGASQAFDETNLGGTSVRVKVVVGR
jgi:hypothetical protein